MFKKCENCGQMFYVKKSVYERRKNCSKRCKYKNKTNIEKMRLIMSGKNNPNYGKKMSEEHKRKISNSNTGKKMSKESIEKIRNSLTGVKTNRIPKSAFKKGSIPWNKGKKHSIKSIKKMSESKKGKIPWNKGLGNNSDEERIRKSLEYKKWKISILKKYNYTCVYCGYKNKKVVKRKKLEAHHIFSFIDNKGRRLDVENGVILCKECHNNFHKIYGKGKNNLIQFKKFMESGCDANFGADKKLIIIK